MDYLITSNRQNSLPKPITHHYDDVEINGQDMLYLYYILLLPRKFGLVDIKTQLLKDKVYASQIIIYLNITILYCIYEAIL